MNGDSYLFFFVAVFLSFPSFAFGENPGHKTKAAVVVAYLDAVEAGRKKIIRDDNAQKTGGELGWVQENHPAQENTGPAAGEIKVSGEEKKSSAPRTSRRARVVESVSSREEKFLQALKNDTREFRKFTVAFLGEDVFICFGPQLAYIAGKATYRIKFDNDYSVGGHCESELEWPLDNVLWGMVLTLRSNDRGYKDRAKYKFDLGFWFSGFGGSSGKMRDLDWIQNDPGFIDNNDDGVLNASSSWAGNNSGVDIYSESEAKVEAVKMLDLNYLYNFFMQPKYSFGLAGGLRYNSFKFSSSSLAQTGYGPYGPGPFSQVYNDDQNLRWDEYSVKTQMPYVAIVSTLYLLENFSLDLKFGISNCVRAKDKDVHLYPNTDIFLGNNYDMISRGTCRGRAYFVDVKGDCRLGPFMIWTLGAHSMRINTKGTLTEGFYYRGYHLGNSGDIDHTIKIKYWMLNSSLAYVF